MKIQIKKERPGSYKGELLIGIVTQSEVQTSLKGKPLEALSGLRKDFKSLFNRKRFKGKGGEVCSIDDVTSSIVICGWNADEKNTSKRIDRISQYRKLGCTIFENAKKRNAKTAGVSFGSINIFEEENFSAFIEGLELSAYEYNLYKEKKSSENISLSSLTILSDKKTPNKILSYAKKIVDSVFIARDLINMPPNDCSAKYLVEKAKEIAKERKIKLEIFDKAKLEKIGAGALLAVAKGSEEPPYLIKMTYKPSYKPSKVISIVGKGITFDSGGLSIKPAGSMEDMKDDMSGAAAVLGAMNAIAQVGANVEVRAYIPTCENMINGKAVRPGDVVKSLSGKTIEILNTDAEGRLILADALHMADTDGADIIIDLATLTGAVMVALGTRYAGLFSDDDELVENIKKAGEYSGEKFWHMPLASEYEPLLKSRIADLKNIGGRYGGSITAALFLKSFVKKAKWAHLDIAGVAFEESDRGYVKKGGVGFGVATLTRFVRSFENNN